MKHSLLTEALAASRCGAIVLLAAGILTAQIPPTSAPATDEPAATPTKLEAFEVTGSRVKRVDYETPVPVVTYTTESIEDKGYTTLGEFVQSLPYSNNTANSEFTTASFITGAATINPRGLGSNRVLTLLNGRRAIPYALTNSASGTPQTVFNFNSIPQAAIDRIDVLKDGASAIYGSDAITGVFNIILKKNYSGTSCDLTLSNTLKHDSLNRRVSLFHGFSRNNWEVMVGVTHSERHANFLTDFGHDSVDYRHLGPKGQSNLSSSNNPSYVQLTAAQAVAAGIGTQAGYYVISGGVPTANPTRSQFVYAGTVITLAAFPNANFFNQGRDTQVFPASESSGLFASINRRLTSSVSAFLQLSYSRSNTYYENTPASFTTSASGMVYPANNPYNPFGIDLVQSGSSAVFTILNTANRPRREVNDRALNSLAGLRGRAFRIWEWESAVGYGVDRARRLNDQIRAADMREVLAGTTRTTAFNLFGPSDNPRVLTDRFVRVAQLDSKIDSFSADLRATASLWQIPLRGAGELGVATGYEYRRDTLRGHPDTSPYLNFTNSVPFYGAREAHAAYLELSVPLQKAFEVQLAGRHELYSDFGQTTKPKVSAKLRLPQSRLVNVLLRASYSESFKAPDLGQLYQKQTSAITSNSISDPLRPFEPARQIRTITGGNPDLQPEEGRIQYVGCVFETPLVKNLSVSVDYFDQQIDNIINSLGVAYLISLDGMSKFPNMVVRGPNLATDPPGVPGPITVVYGVSNNLGFQLYRGWDFGLRYSLRNTRTGTYTFNADIVNTIKRGIDARQGSGFGDVTGRYFAPEWRYNYSLGWRYKQFSASTTADVIGKYYNRGFAAPGWGENVYPIISASFSYRGFKRTTLTLGMNNVMNQRAPVNGYHVFGFDDRSAGSNGALGRSMYLRARREF
jgi:outer membrane receptor protein involved in Fe transport